MRSSAMLWCLLLVLCVSGSDVLAADENEYFLDNAQKTELLMRGQITGRDGARYDIWVVPGYEVPWSHVGKGWKAARRDLDTYGQPGHYSDMLGSTRKVMRFARQDVLREFALRGTRVSWQEASATAQQRVQRRVFGWWFAWPWALIEGSVQSLVRVGAGVPGGGALWAGGALVVPAGYMLYPATLSAGHALGQGTLFPLAAAGWNTVIAPPMALVGQQPAPQRADGWWMKRLADPAEADIRSGIADWQRGWLDDSLAGMQAEIAAAESAHKARVDAQRAVIAEAEAVWLKERKTRTADYQAQALARALAALPALREAMEKQGFSVERLQAQREVLGDELVRQGLDKAVAGQVLDAWLGAMPGAAAARQADDKADPLKQALENIPPK